MPKQKTRCCIITNMLSQDKDERSTFPWSVRTFYHCTLQGTKRRLYKLQVNISHFVRRQLKIRASPICNQLGSSHKRKPYAGQYDCNILSLILLNFRCRIIKPLNILSHQLLPSCDTKHKWCLMWFISVHFRN